MSGQDLQREVRWGDDSEEKMVAPALKQVSINFIHKVLEFETNAKNSSVTTVVCRDRNEFQIHDIELRQNCYVLLLVKSANLVVQNF